MKDSFHKGDIVIIREWDDMEEEFGLDSGDDINCFLTFVGTMKHLCGEIAEIKQVFESGEVLLKFYDVPKEDADFKYSTDMIEHYEEDIDDSDISEKALLNFLSGDI